MVAALTGGPLINAYDQAIGLINEQYPINQEMLKSYFDKSRRTQSKYYGWADRDLSRGFEKAKNYLKKYGYDQVRSDLAGGYEAGRGDIEAGLGRANELFDQAYGQSGEAFDLWDPMGQLADTYGGYRQTYADALGLAGAEGLDRAQDAFGSSLRTNFMQDEAMQAILRQRNAAGGGDVRGGQLDRDTGRWVSDYAGSQTDSWLNRLQGFVPMELQARGIELGGRADALAQGAGILQQQGMLNYGAGSDLGNMAYGYGQDLAQAAGNFGNALANMRMGTSGAIANNRIGLGNNLTNLYGTYANNQVGLNERRVASIVPALIGKGQAAVQASANQLRLGTSLLGGLLSAGSGFLGGAAPA